MWPSPMPPILRTCPLPSVLGEGRALLSLDIALLIVRELHRHAMERPGEGKRHRILVAHRRAIVATAMQAGLGRHDRPALGEVARPNLRTVDQEAATPLVAASLRKLEAIRMGAGADRGVGPDDVANIAEVVFVDEPAILQEERVA